MLKEAERDSRKFLASYDQFKDVDGKLIPANLDFEIETEDKKVSIQITYTRIQIDQEQTYPFRIPESYAEMKDLQPEK